MSLQLCISKSKTSSFFNQQFIDSITELSISDPILDIDLIILVPLCFSSNILEA